MKTVTVAWTELHAAGGEFDVEDDFDVNDTAAVEALVQDVASPVFVVDHVRAS